MGEVKPEVGTILASKCTRAVTLLAIAQKGVYMLNF